MKLSCKLEQSVKVYSVSGAATPGFAEIIAIADALPVPFGGIEVVCGAIVIRLPESTTPKRIADIAYRLARGA